MISKVPVESFIDRLKLLRGYLHFRKEGDKRPPSSPVTQWLTPPELTVPEDTRAVRDGLMDALANYRPSFFAGKIIFVQPTKTIHVFPRSPRSAWGGYAAQFEIRTAPGDHRTQLEQPFVTGLANVITQCIREALSASVGLSKASDGRQARLGVSAISCGGRK